MTEKDYDALRTIVGRDFVLVNREQTAAYMYDEVEPEFRPPANIDSIVVKPSDTDEVSEIVRYAYEHDIPIVVRGGGTGLAGGCTPVVESIVISMERLNHIFEIDEKNMMAVLECGVTLMQLLEELEKHEGLGFPVHPGDEGAQMGGMAVTNAGGARAVRHGVMRKHIMGIEVVLPNGEILQLGGKLVKNNAGYNLCQLILGSEGTLAIVTKVILKLYPKENCSCTIVAPFEDFKDACNAVTDILHSGTIPLAVEYMDKKLFTGTAEMLGLRWQAKEGNSDLMIILSEKTEDRMFEAVETVQNICERHNCYETLIAEKKSEQDELLKIRSEHYSYIVDSICDSFDYAVPVSEIPNFIADLKHLAEEYHTGNNIVAHIADGNVHGDMWYVDGKVPAYAEEYKKRMYDLVFHYGGTITGEHGIGKIRVDDLKLQKNETELNLMRGIKRVFDPKGILNPETVING
ncbi:FAD-binding oxidoreductase [Hornefia butyriciproducens]|uniref:FAD-binding oxidoreductase n=1 Tax=Hornefia butyriciproducens TaxID=2652293 RepID=UPI0023F28E63|nr:FAD-binding oxidoreductase [Hornefia butyriciproducens]MDD6299927.1 FAD-binding oxidoreductase [Hornefia butyriciproducens]